MRIRNGYTPPTSGTLLQMGNPNVHIAPDEFQPAMLSLPELNFLLDHLKEPPIAAFADFDPEGNKKHRGIVRSRVEAVMSRLYELAQLQEHREVEWAGHDTVEDSCTRYLAWQERVELMKARGFRRGEPSMFHWDESGEPYKYAIGADSCELVRSEIMDDGSRKPFGVQLTMTAQQMMSQDLSDVAPWITRSKSLPNLDTVEREVNGRKGLLKCSICGHAESYDTADSGKRLGAHGRMTRHLKNESNELHRHRLLYRKFTEGRRSGEGKKATPKDAS